MLEPRPPRRDPRVLAIVPNGRGIAYAAADAWEIRGVGTLPNGDAAALRLAISRLVVQVRPSAVVCAEPKRASKILRTLLRVVAAVAAHSGIPVVRLAGEALEAALERAPSRADAAAQYPELRTLDGGAANEAVRLALDSLTSLTLPPRSYAPTLRSNRPATLASGRALRARPASVPDRAARRSARRASSTRSRRLARPARR